MSRDLSAPPCALDRGEQAHVAALAALHLVGPARLRWLLSHGTPAEVWESLRRGHLRNASPDMAIGDSRSFASTLTRWREQADRDPTLPATMRERLDRLELRVLVGDEMPERLAWDQVPPGALLVRGRALGSEPRVAVVGTRRATPYGLRIAEVLGRELSQAGICVVSGLALGIDAAAHRGAVAGSAPPVAVIGAGHDRPCPNRNRALAQEVLTAGTVISEVPPGVESAAWRYPVRNRLIAALADVVVVVESASTGGSMLTVGEALDRDRPVMAVPGPVGRRASEGCHDLLRDGAEVCTGAADVLGVLGLNTSGSQTPPDPGAVGSGIVGSDRVGSGLALSGGAEALLDALAEGPLSVDAAIDRSGISMAVGSAAVAELERTGLLQRRGGLLCRSP